MFHSEASEALAQAAQRNYDTPSLEVFKAGLGGALGSLSW